MYERPRLERYGTFRELTLLAPTPGLPNPDVVNGGAAACDCLPTVPPGGGRS